MKQFRSDIEGLRSLAILPILLFHAGVDFLRGGYTGVDIFFVISGYLITQILREDTSSGKFSILKFYQRRIARILPALFLVLAFVVLLAGPILVLPTEIAEVYRSAAATTGFVSNIYFWSTINYFSAAAESRPLLHTWSLGVEEQFYIFFPLLMFALRRMPVPRLRVVFVGLAVLSLVSGLFVQRIYPTADFYLLPFRAWELLLGALLAINAAPRLGPRLRVVAALGGATLIVLSSLLLATWLPFPSPFALAPCVGAALVIGYGESTIVGRVLSLGPVRWIGRISYSLYLWHWPLITFYRQSTGNQLSWMETMGLLVTSIAAAAITYHLVERPAQRALRALTPTRAVALGGGAVVVIVVASLFVAGNAGRIWRVDPRVERIASFENYAEWPKGPEAAASRRCFIENQTERLEAGCLAPMPGKRNVLLFGDSHADMYGAALRMKFPGIHWLQATHFGCPPIVRGWANVTCSEMVAQALGPVLSSGKVNGVVLVSRWRVDQAGRLEETIRLLRRLGLTVTVIGPVPEYQGSFPSLLARATYHKDPAAVSRFMAAGFRDTDRAIGAAAARAGARYLSAVESICPQGHCTLTSPEGDPMHFDYGHLTEAGALYTIRDLPSP
jgi:peptidoglycan/LPS O-acetylase OafA/YrhL